MIDKPLILCIGWSLLLLGCADSTLRARHSQDFSGTWLIDVGMSSYPAGSLEVEASRQQLEIRKDGSFSWKSIGPTATGMWQQKDDDLLMTFTEPNPYLSGIHWGLANPERDDRVVVLEWNEAAGLLLYREHLDQDYLGLTLAFSRSVRNTSRRSFAGGKTVGFDSVAGQPAEVERAIKQRLANFVHFHPTGVAIAGDDVWWAIADRMNGIMSARLVSRSNGRYLWASLIFERGDDWRRRLQEYIEGGGTGAFDAPSWIGEPVKHEPNGFIFSKNRGIVWLPKGWWNFDDLDGEFPVPSTLHFIRDERTDRSVRLEEFASLHDPLFRERYDGEPAEDSLLVARSKNPLRPNAVVVADAIGLIAAVIPSDARDGSLEDLKALLQKVVRDGRVARVMSEVLADGLPVATESSARGGG